MPRTILADIATDAATWAVGYAFARDEGFGFEPRVAQYQGRRGWSGNRASGLPAHGRLDGVDTYGRDTWVVGTKEIGDGAGGGVTGLRGFAAKWNGSSWDVARLPLTPSDQVLTELQDVDIQSRGDVWAVGSRTNIHTNVKRGIVLHHDATSWSRIPVPATVGFISAGAASEDGIWITAGDAIYQLKGAKWRRFDLAPSADARLNLEAVALDGHHRPLVVGYTQEGGLTSRKPTAFRWTGRRWITLRFPSEARASLLDVAVLGSQRAIAVGYTPTGRFYTATLEGNQAVTNSAPSQPVGDEGTLAGVAASTQEIWTVGATAGYGRTNPTPVAASRSVDDFS